MTAGEHNALSAGETQPCTVVVLYEDAHNRAHAAHLCDQLIGRFWSDLEIAVEWWSFRALTDPDSRAQAARLTASADVVVVAAAPDGDLSTGFVEWTELWVPQRAGQEGALVGLFHPALAEGTPSARQIFLHNLALQAGMDYLHHMPDHLRTTIPDSPAWFEDRAGRISGLLDSILHRYPPPQSPDWK